MAGQVDRRQRLPALLAVFTVTKVRMPPRT
jgi:hypothetical protein